MTHLLQTGYYWRFTYTMQILAPEVLLRSIRQVVRVCASYNQSYTPLNSQSKVLLTNPQLKGTSPLFSNPKEHNQQKTNPYHSYCTLSDVKRPLSGPDTRILQRGRGPCEFQTKRSIETVEKPNISYNIWNESKNQIEWRCV